jgi:hypothetical protein
LQCAEIGVVAPVLEDGEDLVGGFGGGDEGGGFG